MLDFVVSKDTKQHNFSPDISLESAITNILDNAAQASLTNGANQLYLEIYVREDQVFIEILDKGQGIDEQLINVLGKEPVNSSEHGLGLGQFLANSTIGRCGGSVWRETSKEGTQTLITLPLNNMNEIGES